MRARIHWQRWAVFLFVLIVGAIALYVNQDRVTDPRIENFRAQDTGPRTERSDLVQLYFGDPEAVALRAELRTIAAGEPVQDRMAACVRELAAGSLEGALDVIPPGARLRGAFLDTWGVAYLDFTRELLGRRPPDDGEEWLAVAAVVRTICGNFAEVAAVRILVEGEMVVSLGGYMDLEEPLRPEDFPLEEDR